MFFEPYMITDPMRVMTIRYVSVSCQSSPPLLLPSDVQCNVMKFNLGLNTAKKPGVCSLTQRPANIM